MKKKKPTENKCNHSQRKWKLKYQEKRASSVQAGHLKMALFGYGVQLARITAAPQCRQYHLNGLLQQRLISHTCGGTQAIRISRDPQVCILGLRLRETFPVGCAILATRGTVKWLSLCLLGSQPVNQLSGGFPCESGAESSLSP